MASRIAPAPDHGAKVYGPPENWRPRDLTIKEKLEIVVRQGGREPGGARLNPLDGVQFDHDPALQLRRWDPIAKDTIPPSCDLAYIVALNKATHREKTTKHDAREIAKTKRLEGRTGKNKRTRKIPSRSVSGCVSCAPTTAAATSRAADAHKRKTAAEMAVKAKTDRLTKKHLGITKSKRGFRKPDGMKFDWGAGRYRRVDLSPPLTGAPDDPESRRILHRRIQRRRSLNEPEPFPSRQPLR